MPDDDFEELRHLARLAWNNWPDTAEARKKLLEHEGRDQFSAEAWDRVVKAILKSKGSHSNDG